MASWEYDALADTNGVPRHQLEARVKALAARAKELEAELFARMLPPCGPPGPIGPTWVGETRPSLEVLAAALPGAGANGPTGA